MPAVNGLNRYERPQVPDHAAAPRWRDSELDAGFLNPATLGSTQQVHQSQISIAHNALVTVHIGTTLQSLHGGS
ncbi:MAG TPA: hypothetical protein VGL55_17395 [Steroidobacteraceae bacterium]